MGAGRPEANSRVHLHLRPFPAPMWGSAVCSCHLSPSCAPGGGWQGSPHPPHGRGAGWDTAVAVRPGPSGCSSGHSPPASPPARDRSGAPWHQHSALPVSGAAAVLPSSGRTERPRRSSEGSSRPAARQLVLNPSGNRGPRTRKGTECQAVSRSLGRSWTSGLSLLQEGGGICRCHTETPGNDWLNATGPGGLGWGPDLD